MNADKNHSYNFLTAIRTNRVRSYIQFSKFFRSACQHLNEI